MMNNVDKFLERLKTFKPLIDDGKIPKKSFDATRSYLELPHFNRQEQACIHLADILLRTVQHCCEESCLQSFNYSLMCV